MAWLILYLIMKSSTLVELILVAWWVILAIKIATLFLILAFITISTISISWLILCKYCPICSDGQLTIWSLFGLLLEKRNDWEKNQPNENLEKVSCLNYQKKEKLHSNDCYYLL